MVIAMVTATRTIITIESGTAHSPARERDTVASPRPKSDCKEKKQNGVAVCQLHDGGSHWGKHSETVALPQFCFA